MTTDLYRSLQIKLDQHSMGFPATASGIELKILRYLFSQEDAEIFLSLSQALEAPAAVADRLGEPREKIALRLEDMAQRGLLFRLEKKGEVKYGAVPFVHGVFEFQVKNLSKDLALMMEEYEQAGFARALQETGGYFVRTIPIQRALDTTQHIAVYEDAVAMLRKKELIVVTDCICRKRTDLIGSSCGKELEACYMFGSMGQYYLDRGMGRRVEVEEAIAILTKCQEAGLVTQPATAQNPMGMCNCCGDCCGVLRALNRHPKPADITFSNYYVEVEKEKCLSCAACLDRCQMQALTMDDQDPAQINRNRCIGCGLCVTVCPTEALKLIFKPVEQQRIPPATSAEQMMKLAQARGIK